MEIVDYKTVTNASATELDKTIKEMLHEGWQPYGSMFIGYGRFYCQTMVKRRDDDDLTIPGPHLVR